jgi:hypothetical protein
METGIVWDEATGDYGVVVAGLPAGHRGTIAEALELLDETAEKHRRHLEAMRWHAHRQAEAQLQAA